MALADHKYPLRWHDSNEFTRNANGARASPRESDEPSRTREPEGRQAGCKGRASEGKKGTLPVSEVGIVCRSAFCFFRCVLCVSFGSSSCGFAGGFGSILQGHGAGSAHRLARRSKDVSFAGLTILKMCEIGLWQSRHGYSEATGSGFVSSVPSLNCYFKYKRHMWPYRRAVMTTRQHPPGAL